MCFVERTFFRSWLLVIICITIFGCANPKRGVDSHTLDAPAGLDFRFWDPSFHRESEVSLNGLWAFDWDPLGIGEEEGWHLSEGKLRKLIFVPFPWGSASSGQGARPPEGGSLDGGTEAIRRNYRGKAWYARSVQVPADWRYETTLVRFGAVDWRCRVFINGELVGTHEGGFDPFEIDVTRWAKPGESFYLALEVEDKCDEDIASLTGKQGGNWYSCAGGIWQDVTLIGRPTTFLEKVIMDEPKGQASSVLRAQVQGEPGVAKVRIAWQCLPSCPSPCNGYEEKMIELIRSLEGDAKAEAHFLITLPAENEWHPDSPCLVTWRIEVLSEFGQDLVDGYVGLRRVSRGSVTPVGERTIPPSADVIFLNGEPFFVRGVLDQCWDPDGLLATSSFERRKADFQLLKDLGFNVVRLHLKPEEPRILALADFLGIGVIMDMPSPPPSAGKLPNAPWVQAWDRLFKALVERDRNHPSILWWVLFNEAWGIDDPPFWTYEDGLSFVRERVQTARELDPSRLIEDNSATLMDGHVDSDLASWHFYSISIPAWQNLVGYLESIMTNGGDGLRKGGGRWTGEPFINTEFGGLAADDTRGDHGWLVHGILNILRTSPSLAGYVFTEAYDVEWEHNGLMTFDRRLKDFGLEEIGLSFRDLFGEHYLVLGEEPGIAGLAGSTFSVPVGFSTLRGTRIDYFRFRVWERDSGTEMQSWEVPGVLCGPGYTPLDSFVGTFPEKPGIYVLGAEAVLSEVVVARNSLYLVSQPAESDLAEHQMRLSYHDASVEGEGDCTPSACWCAGTCSIKFRIKNIGKLSGRPGFIRLTGEFSGFHPAMPQTGAINLVSSRTEIWLDDHKVTDSEFPPPRHDHRGVLSWIFAGETLRGAYGSHLSIELGSGTLKEGGKLTLQALGGGLMVFFERGGRFISPLILNILPEEAHR